MTRKTWNTLLLVIAILILAVGTLARLYWYAPQP